MVVVLVRPLLVAVVARVPLLARVPLKQQPQVGQVGQVVVEVVVDLLGAPEHRGLTQ
jgi:hypothetical protein